MNGFTKSTTKLELLWLLSTSISVEKFTENTTLEYFLDNKEKFILPVDKVPTDWEVLNLLNKASLTTSYDIDRYVKGYPRSNNPMPGHGVLWKPNGPILFNLDLLKFMQNNPHHLEGPLVNHIALMIYRLRLEIRERLWPIELIIHGKYNESSQFLTVEGVRLSPKDIQVLELAIFWSDLGKLATAKPSAKKTWEDGTPWTTAYGHAEKSAEILDEAVSKLDTPPWWYESVRWLVAEHMNAHKLEEQTAKGKTAMPDFLAPQVEGLEPWEWPEFDELDIPHVMSLGKKTYNWIKRNHKLLIIKQKLDEDGRISDLSF